MNSIRTPKKGVTANSRRIAEAVDDEKWQEFRLSLKGKSTHDKLLQLRNYWLNFGPLHEGHSACPNYLVGGSPCGHVSDMCVHCDVCIRIDNYIKALCRGGQLVKGMSLNSILALKCSWFAEDIIKK